MMYVRSDQLNVIHLHFIHSLLIYDIIDTDHSNVKQ